MTTAADLRLTDLLFTPDRDAAFAKLLEGPPVIPAKYMDDTPIWLVTRYADVLTVLSDPRFSNDVNKQSALDLAGAAGLPPDIAPYFMHTIGAYDPPDHTRLRRLVGKEFTARRVERMRPRIQEMASALLDQVGEAEFDLLADFALPLPIQVICELLGVPAEDRAHWHGFLSLISSLEQESVAKGATGLVEYVRALVTAKQAAPDDRLLSALIRTYEDGDRLSIEEVVSVTISLLIGGHETTVHLIGNGVFLLLTNPGQWDRLGTRPDLLPAAIEEMLRFGGSADVGLMRYTLEEVELGGVRIPAGSPVQIVLATAHRDPDRYDQPNQFTIDRADAGHLALGHGLHYCLGAALARVECDIAFRELLVRYPRLTLAEPVSETPWQPGFGRALGTLRVRPKP